MTEQTAHSPRLDLGKVGHQAYAAVSAVDNYLATSSIEKPLQELVKMRVSQINGCAYCMHMHSSDAMKAGETAARLFLLDAWRESSMYTPRERAALAWAEELTRISETHASDEAYADARAQFEENELVDLTLAVTQINAWNRIAIGFRSQHPNDVAAARPNSNGTK